MAHASIDFQDSQYTNLRRLLRLCFFISVIFRQLEVSLCSDARNVSQHTLFVYYPRQPYVNTMHCTFYRHADADQN